MGIHVDTHSSVVWGVAAPPRRDQTNWMPTIRAGRCHSPCVHYKSSAIDVLTAEPGVDGACLDIGVPFVTFAAEPALALHAAIAACMLALAWPEAGVAGCSLDMAFCEARIAGDWAWGVACMMPPE